MVPIFAYERQTKEHTLTKREGVCEVSGGHHEQSGFALIVVLFILLIIVGAAFLC